jgi:hypothetical protein
MIKEQIDKLEDKLLDLEFQDLKKRIAQSRRSWVQLPVSTKPKPAGGSREIMRMKTVAGQRIYEMRSGSTWKPLPKDRAQWPREIREIEDRIDKIDAKRTHGGRIISNMAGSCLAGN